METEVSSVSIASEPRKQLLDLLRSDAIILALGTLLSYTVVFVYEAGACSYFEIPKNLIVLNLSTGLAAAGFLFIVSFGFIFYTRAVLPLTKISSDAEYRYWGNRIAALFFAGYLTIQPGIGILPVVLGSISTWLGVKIIRRWNTYRRSKVAKVHPPPDPPVEFIEHRLPPKAHFWIALFAVLLVVSYNLGRLTALGQATYVTRVDNEAYLVVRIYGDYMIAARYSIQPNREVWSFWFRRTERAMVVGRTLRIFKMGDKDAPKDLEKRDANTLVVRDDNSLQRGFWHWFMPYAGI